MRYIIYINIINTIYTIILLILLKFPLLYTKSVKSTETYVIMINDMAVSFTR